MNGFRTISPAPVSAVLECAGPLAWVRKATIAQMFMGDHIALIDGEGRAVAVAFFAPERRRKLLFALAISRRAAPHMRTVLRFAQLTLAAIADTGVLIVAQIHPENRQGQRMARLAGFRPFPWGSGDKWIWRSQ